MDEQRSGRRDDGTQEHAGADASRRKTGRVASDRGREERNPDTVAHTNSDDRPEAKSDSYAKEFPETDREAESESHTEKERRTQGDAEANSEEGER